MIRTLVLAALLAGAAHAQTADERARVRDLIWAKELANYGGRATTAGMASYIASTSEDYMVWPPGLPKPMRPDELKARAAAAPKGDQEKLALTLSDFTMHDGTAIIYYSSHKTMTATGTPVDERYDTVHVWSRYGADWKLIGGLARRMK